MFLIPSLHPATRYGCPQADQLLFNRTHVIGYSYLFKQPRFAIEIVDPSGRSEDTDRQDSFRSDFRIPELFRADGQDYVGSGYDRGHLVASADQMARDLTNSETFLLSNMSPQIPAFNRGMWKSLEAQVREVASHFAETYVISGPLFRIGSPIDTINNRIPIPHEFFKSVLAETTAGSMTSWNFILSNEDCNGDVSDYQVDLQEIESRAGLNIWDRLMDDAGFAKRSRWPIGQEKQEKPGRKPQRQ